MESGIRLGKNFRRYHTVWKMKLSLEQPSMIFISNMLPKFMLCAQLRIEFCLLNFVPLLLRLISLVLLISTTASYLIFTASMFLDFQISSRSLPIHVQRINKCLQVRTFLSMVSILFMFVFLTTKLDIFCGFLR